MAAAEVVSSVRLAWSVRAGIRPRWTVDGSSFFRGRKVTKLLLDAHLTTTIEAVRPIHGLPDPERQG